MESEKVKEIKKGLECCGMYKYDCEKCPYKSKGDDDDLTVNNGCGDLLLKDSLTLINELESENERLKEEIKQIILCNKGLQDGINEYQVDNKEMGKRNQELKERIAELEAMLRGEQE